MNNRNSSVELFRILATFLVLIVHFNGWFVEMPTHFAGYTARNICQAFIEGISATCVNCFLVITGWYGLRFKWKHIWTIWSIIAFIYVPAYLISSISNNSFSGLTLLLNIIAIGNESYYVQCYLMLIFLSPVLNSFIERYGRKMLPYTLAFWTVEIIFDWILKNKCLGFAHGYELTHFVLMYFLGRTAFLYKEKFSQKFSTIKGIIIYLFGATILSGLYFILPMNIAYSYTNPINILMAFCLFFIFERKHFHNKIINWISSSTLAVYVLHCTPPYISYLQKWDRFALNDFSYINYLGMMGLTIASVFIIGILYDKVRALFMPRIGNIVCNWIESKTYKYSLLK